MKKWTACFLVLICVLAGCAKDTWEQPAGLVPPANAERETPSDVAAPNLNMETLKDLAARSGNNLSWGDLVPYYSEDVGFGMYVLHYPINEDYCLLIGGGSMEEPPMYVRLVSEHDADCYVDIKEDSIDDFLDQPACGTRIYLQQNITCICGNFVVY